METGTRQEEGSRERGLERKQRALFLVLLSEVCLDDDGNKTDSLHLCIPAFVFPC